MTMNQKYEMEKLINRLWKDIDSTTTSEEIKRTTSATLRGIDKALWVLGYKIVYNEKTNYRMIVTIGQYCRMFS